MESVREVLSQSRLEKMVYCIVHEWVCAHVAAVSASGPEQAYVYEVVSASAHEGAEVSGVPQGSESQHDAVATWNPEDAMFVRDQEVVSP